MDEIQESYKNESGEINPPNKKNLIIIIVSIVVVVIIALILILYFALSSSESSGITYTTTISGKSLTFNTINLIKEDTEITSGNYESTSGDQNVFLVVEGATLTLGPNVTITKKGSNSSKRRLTEEPSEPSSEEGEVPEKPDDEGGQGVGGDGDDMYSFYGLNSAIVVIGEGSKAIINGVAIRTNAYGANAVMAVNAGQVDIKNSQIRTFQIASRGLHATYTGKINASDIDIATRAQSCANLATDRGEGTIIAKNMKLLTEGARSPLIYSTGEIQVTNSTGTAYDAQITVVEGKNSVILNDCKFNCTGSPNRGNVFLAGVMIYQSMSGDASVGVGNFEAYNSDLQIIDSHLITSNIPFFFITNTEATITLSNTTTTIKSEVFLNVTGTKEWGKVGSNGGNVNMTVKEQKFNGKISTDNISSVVIYYDSSMTESDFIYEGNVTLHQL